MKAVEASLLNLLGKSSQFVIPIYQRTYSWTETECSQLWADILRAGSSGTLTAHFTGSVVHVETRSSTCTTSEGWPGTSQGKGHWSNGPTEVALNEESDFASVMGLVRHAYERQLGGE